MPVAKTTRKNRKSGSEANPFRLLRLKEAADRLNVSRDTVMRLIRNNELPAVTIGGLYQVRESDVDKCIHPVQTQRSNEQIQENFGEPRPLSARSAWYLPPGRFVANHPSSQSRPGLTENEGENNDSTKALATMAG